MACRVPGCSTKYWNKNNNYTLFKAPSEKQLADWQEILRGAGVFDFNKTDKVCILHFEANCIERERVLHKRGGTVFKEPRKMPVLSYTAVPTIFPPKNPKNEKKKQLNYAVVLDEEALLKQKEIFKENISSDGTLPREDMKNVKRLKLDNLFNVVANAIHNHKGVSPHLDSRWVANYLDRKCVKWSLWKADRSGIEKTINLYEDLTAELFIDEKKIFLPELENISEMADLQTLFKKVCQIVPCKRTNYDTEDSANVYMGFVVKSVGRPRSWYPPCCRYEKYRHAPGGRITEEVHGQLQKVTLITDKDLFSDVLVIPFCKVNLVCFILLNLAIINKYILNIIHLDHAHVEI